MPAEEEGVGLDDAYYTTHRPVGGHGNDSAQRWPPPAKRRWSRSPFILINSQLRHGETRHILWQISCCTAGQFCIRHQAIAICAARRLVEIGSGELYDI